jgi:hypothetical protein
VVSEHRAALLVYRLTKSSFWVGVANFAQFIGVVILAPWVGTAADRMALVGPRAATIMMALPTAGAVLLAFEVKHCAARAHAPSSRANR